MQGITVPSRGFSARFIESIKPREQRFDVSDPAASGLRLRVHPSGLKTFRWVVNSVGRVINLGPWAMETTPAHMTLGEARRWLERLKEAHRAGPDRLEAVEAALQLQLNPPPPKIEGQGTTVADVAENFLRMLDGQRKRPEDARTLTKKDILPVIGNLPLRDLKKSHCRAVVARVVGRGARVHAGKVLGLLKQLLDYAENVEDDFINPAARLKAANLEVENNVRDRWLSEDEIKLLWEALEKWAGTPETEKERAQVRASLRLLLLTAARSGELRLAQWTDVDFKACTWTIPVKNQKLTLKQARQAKPFVIPLSPTAVSLFKELQRIAGDSPWVLASENSKEGNRTDKALGLAMRRFWNSHPQLKKLPSASPHDLRRTARTWLGKLRIPPHIAERCLNHKLGKIIATYDQGDYLEERRAAMEKWDAFLQRTLSGEDAVAFLPASGA